ncbi:MAG: hypothetical protein ACK5BL_06945 [Flavobacteriales bacterium]
MAFPIGSGDKTDFPCVEFMLQMNYIRFGIVYSSPPVWMQLFPNP